MDEAALLLRIRVVVGSTRAAARSLGTDIEQVDGVLERGRRLLDDLAIKIERDGSPVVRERLVQAWAELDEIARSSGRR